MYNELGKAILELLLNSHFWLENSKICVICMHHCYGCHCIVFLNM